MRLDYIVPILDVSEKLVEELFHEKPKRGQVTIKEKGITNGDGVCITIGGDVSGSVIIMFPSEVAFRLKQAMIGDDELIENQEIIKEALMEFGNILVNGIATRFEEEGFRFLIERLDVIRELGVPKKVDFDVECLFIPYIIRGGEINIFVSLQEVS